MAKRVITITMNPCIDKTVLVDQFQVYGLNRVHNIRLDPGGKGINVAKVLQNFQVDVLVSGLIAGKQGSLLLQQITQLGIQNDFLEIEGETRINLKIVDESVCKTTEVNEPGFFVAEQEIDNFFQKYQLIIQQAEMIILAGSLPPGVPDDFYARCITLAKKSGIKTILDADGVAFAKGIEAKPYAIKPNILELQHYLNCEAFENVKQVADAAQKLLDTGIEIVIVSMGKDGAVVADHTEIVKTDTWTVPVKSTVGAGDSMVGSLAYSIIQQFPLSEIAKITTAAGTITASKSGTLICTLEEVLDAMNRVSIKKFK